MCMHMRVTGENSITQVCRLYQQSVLSLTRNCAPVLCLQLPHTPWFYTVSDHAVSCQAAPPSWVLAEMQHCFPAPLPGDGARSNAQWQSHPGVFAGRATAGVRGLALGASPPQKKFLWLRRSVSGIMENHWWPRLPRPPLLLWIHPSHQSTPRLSCGVSASALPVYRVLLEFKLSPFSPFSSVSAAFSTFLSSCFYGR